MPTPMPGPVCAYCGRTTIWGGCPCHGAHLAAKDRVIQEQAATIVALREALEKIIKRQESLRSDFDPTTFNIAEEALEASGEKP